MIKRLKPDRNLIGLMPAFFSLLLFALTSAIFGLTAGKNALGVLILIYSIAFGIWGYIKTQNKYQLVTFIYMVTFGTFLLVLDPNNLKSRGGRLESPEIILLVLFYFILIIMIYILVSKKLKWRGRELYELAGWHVEASDNSFTERPRPVGSVNYTKYDILDFASFMKTKLICSTYLEDNRIILVPVMNSDEFRILYNPSFDYTKETWIAIDFDGNVSVHFALRNYLNYQENLSLDQLCDSLGNMMIEFMDMYMRNEQVRIMDRINSINTGLFS